MNPYFPVPPCEYGGPLQAILAGDMNAVFLLDEPELIPRHNTYEFLWFLKTGYTRSGRYTGTRPCLGPKLIIRFCMIFMIRIWTFLNEFLFLTLSEQKKNPQKHIEK